VPVGVTEAEVTASHDNRECSNDRDVVWDEGGNKIGGDSLQGMTRINISIHWVGVESEETRAGRKSKR
jgi:hypothetical protein